MKLCVALDLSSAKENLDLARQIKNFDVWLRQLAGDSAIKHFEAIEKLANTHGLKLLEDCTMPANNRILVWQKN